LSRKNKNNNEDEEFDDTHFPNVARKTMPNRLDSLSEDVNIKFVSMIDQKPIQPNYLDLIPMKNFDQKETEATRKTNKDA